MKIPVCGAELEISDWSYKLKIATFVLAVSTIISYILMLFTEIELSGLPPITLGCTLLLLGIKMFNVYFKGRKHKVLLMVGIVFSVMYTFLLYVGINKIVDTINGLIRM